MPGMVARTWAMSWWASAPGTSCPVCREAIGLLPPDAVSIAQALALELLSSTDPRNQALLALGTLGSRTGAEVLLLAPEGADTWFVLASTKPGMASDLLVASSRWPELATTRRDGAPVLPIADRERGGSSQLAVLPVFRPPWGAEPVVLLLDWPAPPDAGQTALAALVAHILLHRLQVGDSGETATRLGLRPARPRTFSPDWLHILPLPALLIDSEDRHVASNSAASWLLQRTDTTPSRNPGPLAALPPRPWLGGCGPWVARVQAGDLWVDVRGWSNAMPAGGFLLILERVGPDEDPQREGFLRSNLQAKIGELEAANRRLEELARIRTRFVSDAAHELKTPLAILRSYLEALGTDLADGLGRQQREFLAAATEGSRRLQRLVEQLLDLAAIESGNLSFDVESVTAPAALRAVFEELTPIARLAGVDLRLGPVEPVALRADATRLAQILRNLMANALKFTGPGGHVRLSCRRRGEVAVIEVADTGVGIPAAELSRIFDEFYRARSLPASEGAGLGLSIVRRLVLAMGGRIEVVSEAGAGSRFAVELPIWTGAP